MKVLFVLVLLFLVDVLCVDRSKFKTCESSSFCKRNRRFSNPSDQPRTLQDFRVVPESIRVSVDSFTVDIDSGEAGRQLVLDVTAVVPGVLRARFREKNAAHRRYEVQESLVPLEMEKIVYKPKKHTISSKESSLAISFHPFQLDFYNAQGQHVVNLNQRHFLNWEFFRSKPQELANDIDGEWDEKFQSHDDTKPRGPTSVGMDVTFVNVDHVYGIPEHATNLSLPATRGTNKRYDDPFRLYNLDVFEYELDNPMALYGHVPFLVGHSKSHTSGMLWLNAAETWIDIDKTTTPGSVSTHWMSESGIIDVFLLPGPTPRDVLAQYARLTGTSTLPPRFAIAYHQCKWNYKSEQEVSELDANFDKHNIPYDVVWLDIEHTNGKRYMTWDSTHFPTPKRMVDEIASKGRRMVTIVDPHLKRDSDYSVHSSASKGGHYVRDRHSNEYDGWCWPGSSSWPDFTQKSVRDWWASLFNYSVYHGSTPSLYTWNDMNEPSVFNGPEVTMHKDAIHLDGFEHRDVHNLYGMAFHMATESGQLNRNQDQNLRTFVLSRAMFAGTQRFGAIWTGDNAADWGHLRISNPMLTTLGIAGVAFVGADVGGFFGNPDGELLSRWYQAAAFQPFFRGHAHLDSKRREPWVYEEPFMSYMRDAIRTRYTLLPYFYTLFREASLTGFPVMRAMWLEFPHDENTFALEDQFMLGSSILVAPATTPGQSHVQVYLPPASSTWYRFDTLAPSSSSSSSSLQQHESPLQRGAPAWIRAGSIIIKQERTRRSSSQMTNDPFTLIIALNDSSSSTGQLYWDDGETFNYSKSNHFIHRNFTYSNNRLTNTPITPTSFSCPNIIERITIVSPNGTIKTLRKPNLRVDQDWTFDL